MAYNPQSIALTKNYFLKGVLLIYIIAFTSLYVQVQSLFGDNGIVPLRDFLAKPNNPSKGPMDAYNIISFAPKLSLSHGTFVELLCLFAVVVAFSSLLVRRFANAFTFGLLWYIYYSLCQVGQGFMSFHSDLLLLEVGFITILLAPLMPTSKQTNADHDHLGFFLIRWLTFRYFVTNVLNVYLDNDKAWYDMTAIPMVAQGVQFPSLISWQIFNLPTNYVKVLQGYEHAIKLCTPFLFLFDLKFSRRLAFYTLFLISGLSTIFFNFGWTDMLISICLVTYLKDAHFYSDKRTKQSTLRSIIDIAVMFIYVAVVVAILVKGYGLKYANDSIQAQVMFKPEQFKLLVDHLVPISFVLGILGLMASLRTTYFTSGRKTSIIKTLVYTLIMVPIFFSTFPTMTRFAPGLETKIKPLAYTKELSRMTAPLMLSNNYLLLSKVSQYYGDGRPELQLQGRASADEAVWQQFDLRYKPGQASKLGGISPHLPRIDLKFWYAARSSLQNNQWIQTLAYRLATGEKDVLNAFSQSGSLPKVSQVRVAMHNYKYSLKAKAQTAHYWSQFKFVSEYMPGTSIENLKFAVKSNGISLAPTSKSPEGSQKSSLDMLLNRYLDISSDYIRGVDHLAVVWTTLAVALVSLLK